MPRWLKITLLVAGLGGLAVFGSCSACAYWFKGASEELQAKLEVAAEEAKEAYVAGQTLGSGLDDANLCFDHGEEAFAACGGDPSAIMENGKCVNNAKMGIRGCIEKAPPSDQLCENVPRSLNFQMLMDEQAKRCPKGSPPECALRFQARVEICELMARAKAAQEAAVKDAVAKEAAAQDAVAKEAAAQDAVAKDAAAQDAAAQEAGKRAQ